jgi:hypothetical protein
VLSTPAAAVALPVMFTVDKFSRPIPTAAAISDGVDMGEP